MRCRTTSALLCLALLPLIGALGCTSGNENAAPPGATGTPQENAGSEDGAAAAPRKGRLILLTNGSSPFWDAARAGLEEAEKELDLKAAGFDAVMVLNDGTLEGQLSKLRQYGTQADVVGVAVSALDASNSSIADEMRKLKAKGVHVVTLDSDVDREQARDARSYYIGTDNRTGGEVLGTAAKHLLEAQGIEQGQYVQFVGLTGAQNAVERMDGFEAAIGASGKELDRMGDETDASRARENVRNAIQNNPELNVLVGIWSYNAPAIVDVVRETKTRDRMLIVTFDAEQLAIERMGEGLIDVMVVQDPFSMGYQSIRLLKAMEERDNATLKEMFPNEDQENGDIFDTGLKVVVPDANSPLKAEMFQQKVQFLPLKDFRAWLTKYGLKSS